MLIIVLCVLMLMGTWGLFGWVMYETVGARERALRTLAEREGIREKVAYSETLRSLLRDTSGERDLLEEISTLSAVDVVELMRRVAQDTSLDMRIDSIAPTTVQSGAVRNTPVLAVSLSARGRFADLYHFLTLMETLPVPAMIDQVTFENVGSVSSWSLRMRVLVYTERSV